MPDDEWIAQLSIFLDDVADMRINHVREWITSNLSRFKTSHANVDNLRRTFDDASVDLKANVQLCKMQCASCNLFCLRNRGHEAEEPHDCQTDHHCGHLCDLGEEHPEEEKDCGYPYVFFTRIRGAMKRPNSFTVRGTLGCICTLSLVAMPSQYLTDVARCAVDIHLCGKPCKLNGKRGCSGECTKVCRTVWSHAIINLSPAGRRPYRRGPHMFSSRSCLWPGRTILNH
jgi:hypothetical protein